MPNETKLQKDIREHGCHVVGVLEGDGEPSFSYSVGLFQSAKSAELLIIGLDVGLARRLINRYSRSVQANVAFQEGEFYEDFLEGFEVCFCGVAQQYRGDYLLACERFYHGEPYPVMQLIWPTTLGQWPWDSGISDLYRWSQPVLDGKELTEGHSSLE